MSRIPRRRVAVRGGAAAGRDPPLPRGIAAETQSCNDHLKPQAETFLGRSAAGDEGDERQTEAGEEIVEDREGQADDVADTAVDAFHQR